MTRAWLLLVPLLPLLACGPEYRSAAMNDRERLDEELSRQEDVVREVRLDDDNRVRVVDRGDGTYMAYVVDRLQCWGGYGVSSAEVMECLGTNALRLADELMNEPICPEEEEEINP